MVVETFVPMRLGDAKTEQLIEMLFWCLVGSLYVDCITPLLLDGFDVTSVACMILWLWMVTWLLRDWILPQKRKILDFFARIFERLSEG